MSARSAGAGREGKRDQIVVLPPVLVSMTAKERDRAVVAVARLLVELAATSAPSGTPSRQRRHRTGAGPPVTSRAELVDPHHHDGTRPFGAA